MARIAIAANNAWNVVNYRAGLVRALIDAGLDVAVIAPDGPEAPKVQALGASFHPLPMQPRGRSPIADLRLLAGYRSLLKGLGASAFLGFTAKPNIWGAMAARSLGIPVVANVSGLGAVFVRGGPLKSLVSALYRAALGGRSTVFFQNAEDRDLFVKAGIATAQQSFLLPGSGIDLGHFAPAPPPEGKDKAVTFLFAGRLLWAKGVAEFVEAGARLRAEHPGARLQILGLIEPQGPTAVPRSALDRWQREGLADYLGATDDVRPAIDAADCVVLPSYYREGVPHILLEAASMARPVITTDAAGCRDAVDDGVSGLLCAPRSVDSLAGAMRKMIELGPEGRASMGLAGRAKMERQFDQELVHRCYIDALSRIGILKH